MTPTPKGQIVRTIRISNTETLQDGSVVTVSVSGPGAIIHIKTDVEGMKPSNVRRAFVRAAKELCVCLEVVETAHGHYSASGKPIAESLPSAYQCVGNVAAIEKLIEHFAVEKWHFALNVPLPRGAQGSGPAKVRPAKGSEFGKTAQVKATARTLTETTSKTVAKKNRE